MKWDFPGFNLFAIVLMICGVPNSFLFSNFMFLGQVVEWCVWHYGKWFSLQWDSGQELFKVCLSLQNGCYKIRCMYHIFLSDLCFWYNYLVWSSMLPEWNYFQAPVFICEQFTTFVANNLPDPLQQRSTICVWSATKIQSLLPWMQICWGWQSLENLYH